MSKGWQRLLRMLVVGSRITTLTIPKDKIRDVIGTGGKVIEICETTGTKMMSMMTGPLE